jgi:hypothetical protein
LRRDGDELLSPHDQTKGSGQSGEADGKASGKASGKADGKASGAHA